MDHGDVWNTMKDTLLRASSNYFIRVSAGAFCLVDGTSIDDVRHTFPFRMGGPNNIKNVQVLAEAVAKLFSTKLSPLGWLLLLLLPGCLGIPLKQAGGPVLSLASSSATLLAKPFCNALLRPNKSLGFLSLPAKESLEVPALESASGSSWFLPWYAGCLSCASMLRACLPYLLGVGGHSIFK